MNTPPYLGRQPVEALTPESAAAPLDGLLESAMAISTPKLIEALEELICRLKAGAASREELARMPADTLLEGLRCASRTPPQETPQPGADR